LCVPGTVSEIIVITIHITASTLTKAACCNLSESFGSSTTIDISNTDAVTGSKQLQMFGLDGTYVQMNVENIPNIRGLNTSFGLNYIPGTWISSINIGKGAGSVVNGYESMTGQINVELQKPDISDRLYLNSYVNEMGRTETNLHLSQRFNKHWSTLLLLHGSGLGRDMDRNDDNFRDGPRNTQFNILNRWKYESPRYLSNFGVQAVYNDRIGGEINQDSNGVFHQPERYLYKGTTKRINVFSKFGFLYPEKPFKSIGIIVNGSLHEDRSVFGDKTYAANQKSFYANLIYLNIIQNTAHQYKLGASIMIDDFRERFSDSLMFHRRIDTLFNRTEIVPGIFGEYTYKPSEKVTTVIGFRTDYNSLYGWFYTPRLHLIYNPDKNTAFRLSAGKGYRIANPLSENVGLLASSREVIFAERISPEISWSYGFSFTKSFTIATRTADINIDLFRTDFINQLVTDRDKNPNAIYFYNLDGKSFSNSIQTEFSFYPFKRLQARLGYKWNDVKATINGNLADQPFVSKQKMLLQFGYTTKSNKWSFDISGQWIGVQRIPGSEAFLQQWSLSQKTQPYFLANMHINKKVTRNFEVYAGVENVADFRQTRAILDYQNPFSKNFDASLIWGPLTGRLIYGGFRFKMN